MILGNPWPLELYYEEDLARLVRFVSGLMSIPAEYMETGLLVWLVNAIGLR